VLLGGFGCQFVCCVSYKCTYIRGEVSSFQFRIQNLVYSVQCSEGGEVSIAERHNRL
jgi:hypothetical protein